MEFSKIVYCFALLALTAANAFAQEDPAAVYAKLHSATLAGNTAEVLSYGTAAAQAELAAKPQAEKLSSEITCPKSMPTQTYRFTSRWRAQYRRAR